MIAGFGITIFYLVMTQYGADFDKATPNMELWWGVKNISSAAFGLPVGFAVMIVVSLTTKAPSPAMQEFIEEIRVPRGKTVMEEKIA